MMGFAALNPSYAAEVMTPARRLQICNGKLKSEKSGHPRRGVMNTRDESAGMNPSRRRFFRSAAVLGGMGLLGGSRTVAAAARSVELPMANGTRELAVYPQKRELILMTARPVQLETPFQVFNEGVYTPNDAFFVRWHLAAVPTSIDASTFRIQVHGRVKQPLALTVADLQNGFEKVEISAVCQCSGNSRGFFNPRVTGGEWGNGAMGNARWTGVRLRDVLQKAGVESDAVQVRFNGADGPVIPATPDFIKALDLPVALRDNVLLAYRMNGEPLPLLNGYPLRLVVPGWFAILTSHGPVGKLHSYPQCLTPAGIGSPDCEKGTPGQG